MSCSIYTENSSCSSRRLEHCFLVWFSGVFWSPASVPATFSCDLYAKAKWLDRRRRSCLHQQPRVTWRRLHLAASSQSESAYPTMPRFYFIYFIFFLLLVASLFCYFTRKNIFLYVTLWKKFEFSSCEFFEIMEVLGIFTEQFKSILKFYKSATEIWLQRSYMSCLRCVSRTFFTNTHLSRRNKKP